MEILNLNELIKKYKRNSKLSNADSEFYESELMKLLNNNDYCDEIENFLCEGPLDSSMKVLTRYAKFSDNIDKTYKMLNSFLHCNRIEENKGGTSGMKMVYLMMSFMDEDITNAKMLRWVFLAMVRMSYKNGKNETNKKVVDLIRTCLFPKMTKEEDFIDINFINRDNTWVKVRDLFIECAYESADISMKIKEKVFYWLNNTANDMGKYTEEYLAKTYIKKNEEVVQPKEETSTEIKKNDKLGEMKIDEIIKKLIICVLSEDKVIKDLQLDVKSLKVDMDKMQTHLIKSIANEKAQDSRISELCGENQLLNTAKKDLEKMVEELSALVENLKNEIDDRKQFTDTVARNREKQSEEFINKIASKLKLDYSDFCDAKDLEMTIDLGENMRTQLESIFLILEKSGIKLK